MGLCLGRLEIIPNVARRKAEDMKMLRRQMSSVFVAGTVQYMHAGGVEVEFSWQV